MTGTGSAFWKNSRTRRATVSSLMVTLWPARSLQRRRLPGMIAVNPTNRAEHVAPLQVPEAGELSAAGAVGAKIKDQHVVAIRHKPARQHQLIRFVRRQPVTNQHGLVTRAATVKRS